MLQDNNPDAARMYEIPYTEGTERKKSSVVSY